MNFDPGLPDETVNVSDGSAVGEAAWLLGGVVAVVVLSVTLLALSVDVAVRWIPPSVEARVFGGWADAASEMGDAEPDPRQAQVQALMDRMASHWTDAPYTFRVNVTEAADPNAFALPGGLVVVTTGLLDRVRTENELAFVLGHELGHFKNRDHLRGLGRNLAWSIVSAALGMGEGAATALAQVAGGLSNRHFDRDQETQSDEFGLELLAAEYGHVGGSAAVFAYLLAPEADGEEEEDALGDVVDVLGGYLSTHPSHEDRIDDLAEYAEDHGWRADGPATPWIVAGTDASQGSAAAPE